MGGGGCAGAGLCVHGSSLHAQSIRLPLSGRVGREPKLLVISLSQLGLTALFTFLAAPYGLFAVAWAYVARAYLTLPLQVILLKRASGIGFGRTWAAIWEPLAASAVMGIALHYGLPAAERLTANPWLRLTRSEEHTSELQSLMRISYAVFCLKKKNSIS